MKIFKKLTSISLSVVLATPGTFPWIEDNGIDIQQGSRGIISKLNTRKVHGIIFLSDMPIYEYEYDQEVSATSERGAIQVRNHSKNIQFITSFSISRTGN